MRIYIYIYIYIDVCRVISRRSGVCLSMRLWEQRLIQPAAVRGSLAHLSFLHIGKQQQSASLMFRARQWPTKRIYKQMFWVTIPNDWINIRHSNKNNKMHTMHQTRGRGKIGVYCVFHSFFSNWPCYPGVTMPPSTAPPCPSPPFSPCLAPPLSSPTLSLPSSLPSPQIMFCVGPDSLPSKPVLKAGVGSDHGNGFRSFGKLKLHYHAK